MASAGAMAYLAWRALVAHPLRRLRRRGTGLERFLASYAPEGLVPTRPEDRAVSEAAQACISCGLCELGCELAGAAPAVRAMGLHAAFTLWSRSAGALSRAGEALRACQGCRGCEPLCPTGVPIGRIVRHLLGEVAAREPQAAAPPAERTAGGAERR